MKPLAVICPIVLFAVPVPVFADTSYSLGKSRIYTQISASPPIPSIASFEIEASSSVSSTLILPSGATFALASSDGRYSLQRAFADERAQASIFPDGRYQLSALGLGTLAFNLTDAQPTTIPQVVAATNATWNSAGHLVVTNPALPTTLTFNTFSGYATDGVVGSAAFILDNTEYRVSSGNLGSHTGTLQPMPFTSYTIPPGTLAAGQTYSAELMYITVTELDTARIPDGVIVTAYHNMTRFRLLVPTPGGSVPVFTYAPASQVAPLGGSVVLHVATAHGEGSSTTWYANGRIPRTRWAPTVGDFIIDNLSPTDAGLYVATVTGSGGAAMSRPAIVGLSSTTKVAGNGEEVGTDIRHPNGNTFDQVLLTGSGETITSDWGAGQITRTSFIDLDDDIVQVEFSGPGTLTLVLDQPTGPGSPLHYSQNASYMKGHAGIVITGADERTNLAIFTVGRATAFDPTGNYNILVPPGPTNVPANNGSPLFVGHGATSYDGIADLAFIAIVSTNGRFGGVRAANANLFAAYGFTGVYAPDVAFQGPLFVGDISAFDAAMSVLQVGSVADARITGGDMLQANQQPVIVSGLTQLRFTAGSDSHGNALPAQLNRATFRQNGEDITSQIVVNPTP